MVTGVWYVSEGSLGMSEFSAANMVALRLPYWASCAPPTPSICLQCLPLRITAVSDGALEICTIKMECWSLFKLWSDKTGIN